MNGSRQSDGRPDRRLGTGIFLIGLGAILFLAQLRRFNLEPLARYWPLLILGFGVFRLVSGRGRTRWSGYWLIVTGIYCSIGAWELLGLSFGTAWPIFVIAAGVSALLRGTIDRH